MTWKNNERSAIFLITVMVSSCLQLQIFWQLYLLKLLGLDWNYCQNVEMYPVQVFFYGCYFGRFSFKLAELVPLPYACGGSIVQIGCAIHLLLFLDGMIMSLWTVDVYPYKARLGIFFLQDYFVWLIWMDLIHSCTAFIIWLFLICFSMSLSRENNTVW